MVARALPLLPSLLLSLASLGRGEDDGLNLRPLVGIMTQPRVGIKGSYLAASYVKFVEAAGAQAVPIVYDLPEDDLKELFSSINGILYPGGGANLANTSTYATASRFLFDLALKANDEGDHFPIWGTCLGFELINMMVAEDDRVLCAGCFDTGAIDLSLNFTDAARDSRMFGSLSDQIYNATATMPLTENSHRSGIAPESYADGTRLADFFTILSTNVDPKGREFISSIEAKKYPVFATQWHPEKAMFEWNAALKIPHEPEAIMLSQSLANVIVNEARKSHHSFESPKDEDKALIYNYVPKRDPSGYFTQIYEFDPVEA